MEFSLMPSFLNKGIKQCIFAGKISKVSCDSKINGFICNNHMSILFGIRLVEEVVCVNGCDTKSKMRLAFTDTRKYIMPFPYYWDNETEMLKQKETTNVARIICNYVDNIPNLTQEQVLPIVLLRVEPSSLDGDI